MAGANLEVKADARNLTGTRYQEGQTFAGGNEVFTNRYRVGLTFSVGLSTTF